MCCLPSTGAKSLKFWKDAAFIASAFHKRRELQHQNKCRENRRFSTNVGKIQFPQTLGKAFDFPEDVGNMTAQ